MNPKWLHSASCVVKRSWAFNWKHILRNMRTACAFLLFLWFGEIGTAQKQQGVDARLPTNLAAEVQRLGCTIPQRSESNEGLEVIRGDFGRKRITDWAVLCWRARVTTLLVFWSGSELGPAELWRTLDGDGQHLSIRRIRAVDKRYIVAHCQSPGDNLPPIDHQGILDGFDGSVVHYYYQGKWLHLTVTQ
jgi:hypothetical protein